MSKLLLRVDGSCMPNPGEMAIGIVIYRDGMLIKQISETAGHGTNNIAEYMAVIRGLEEIKDLEAEMIEFYCDSQLVVKQLNGVFKVKDKKMLKFHQKIQTLLKEIGVPTFFIWNRREENHLADHLAKNKLIKGEHNKRVLASKELAVFKDGQKFIVESTKGKKSYLVDLEIPECDCYDFIHHCKKWNIECKHIVAARNYILDHKNINPIFWNQKIKVLILSKMFPKRDWQRILGEKIGKESKFFELLFSEKSQVDRKKQIAMADVIVGGNLDQEDLKIAKKLKLFQLTSAGVDKQDLQIFKSYPEIAICNSHENRQAVAEHALCLLLALAKNLISNDYELRRGHWHGQFSGEPSLELGGKSIGIIGLGAIGLSIAEKVKALGMKIFAIKKVLEGSDEIKEKYGISFIGTTKEMGQVITMSDFIVVTLPLTRETENMFNENVLKRMKGKYLINIGRGKVIDEKALYDALKNNLLAGAAIDTWYQYPHQENQILFPSQYPFHELENIIISPHNAGYSDRAIEKSIEIVYQNLIRLANGERLMNRINPDKGY